MGYLQLTLEDHFFTCFVLHLQIQFLCLGGAFLLTLNSNEQPRQNFSLQYQYYINRISDENREEYQVGDNWLIQD